MKARNTWSILLLMAILPMVSGCAPKQKSLAELKKEAVEAPRLAQISSSKSLPAPQPNPAFFRGLAYGPFRGIENPACGPLPTREEIASDLDQLSRWTKAIRIYEPSDIIIEEASKRNLEVLVGCWLGKEEALNETALEKLVTALKKYDLKKGVVGNEVVLREDLTVSQLIGYLKRVKLATKVQIGTAELWQTWLVHPELAKASDFLVVHAYAFWDGVAIDKAADYVASAYLKVKKAYPDKLVILGETGWPKEGLKIQAAVPSEENQARFIREFTALANSQDKGFPYFYFEAFDEDWKVVQEGGVGGSWGGYFLKRAKSFTTPKVSHFPFVVYDDLSPVSHFIPSGWMGDLEAIDFNPGCQTKPHSGKTCIKISYESRWLSYSWAGIYWQYPENNWGDLPGYHFRGVHRLTFWARGEKGGERSEFKTGGIVSAGKRYRDSLALQTTGVMELTKDWQKYTILIPEGNLDCVISGFCWVTNYPSNPEGVVIYLDDIQFE